MIESAALSHGAEWMRSTALRTLFSLNLVGSSYCRFHVEEVGGAKFDRFWIDPGEQLIALIIEPDHGFIDET